MNDNLATPTMFEIKIAYSLKVDVNISRFVFLTVKI